MSILQSWYWANFLEVLMSGAFKGEAASKRSTSLEGLPKNFLGYTDILHQLMDNDNWGAVSS